MRRSGLPASTDCWPRTSFAFARHEICSPNSTFSVQLPVHCHHSKPPHPYHPAVMVTELWKNKLRNMRHGRWQTHGHIVTETDGVSVQRLTDSHFPILTSSMQAIRKDRRTEVMWDTAESRKTGILAFEWHSKAEWVALIAENIVYMCIRVFSVLMYHFHSCHGTTFLYKKINDLTYWHKLFSILAPNPFCYPFCIQENISYERGWKSMR